MARAQITKTTQHNARQGSHIIQEPRLYMCIHYMDA